MRIKKVRDRVEWMLTNHPRLRDSDDALVANMWHHETKEITSRMELLQLMACSELTSYQSISRCRRKLQEEKPELRGTNYKARQAEQEPVKDEISNW